MNTKTITTRPMINQTSETEPVERSETALEVSNRALEMIAVLNRLLDPAPIASDEECIRNRLI